MRAILIFATLLTLSNPFHADGQVRLTVVVRGIRHSRGRLRISLFHSAKGFPMQYRYALKKTSVRIRDGRVAVTFRNLAQGRYSVAVHHDENGNTKMDTNFFGKPKEGWCVSRNAPMRTFGPPKFMDAAFLLRKSKTIRIRMRY